MKLFRSFIYPLRRESLYTFPLYHRGKAWQRSASLSTVTLPRLQEQQGLPTASDDHIKVQVKNGVRHIIFNRPDKKNAITVDMFRKVIKSMAEANSDEETVVVAITGVGDYFTSGMDMTPRSKDTEEVNKNKSTETEEGKKSRRREGFNKFLQSFVECKKPIIALVNGPSLGVGVTFLGLVDAVYASDRATFHTNFTRFALPPEMGSTYTFPNIMGYLKASNLLMFNQKITAQEAYRCGLVSRVFPHERFVAETEAVLKGYGELPVKSLIYSKELVRGRWKDTVIKVSEQEQSHFDPEMAKKVIMQFMARKMQKS